MPSASTDCSALSLPRPPAHTSRCSGLPLPAMSLALMLASFSADLFSTQAAHFSSCLSASASWHTSLQ